MTPDEIRERIEQLKDARSQVQAEFDRLLNYQFGRIDGEMAALSKLLEALEPAPETPVSPPAAEA